MDYLESLCVSERYLDIPKLGPEIIIEFMNKPSCQAVYYLIDKFVEADLDSDEEKKMKILVALTHILDIVKTIKDPNNIISLRLSKGSDDSRELLRILMTQYNVGSDLVNKELVKNITDMIITDVKNHNKLLKIYKAKLEILRNILDDIETANKFEKNDSFKYPPFDVRNDIYTDKRKEEILYILQEYSSISKLYKQLKDQSFESTEPIKKLFE